MTSISRQTRALTELAFQLRYRTETNIAKVRTERENEADAEREKTLRLRSLRLARNTAEHEHAIALEVARPAVINRWRDSARRYLNDRYSV